MGGWAWCWRQGWVYAMLAMQPACKSVVGLDGAGSCCAYMEVKRLASCVCLCVLTLDLLFSYGSTLGFNQDNKLHARNVCQQLTFQASHYQPLLPLLPFLLA